MEEMAKGKKWLGDGKEKKEMERGYKGEGKGSRYREGGRRG